ncbi:TIGR04255 family protein [candidate division KSB1 bacterium]|nr:TIGR04255 family protein [candidate division KSB1 bacterium]
MSKNYKNPPLIEAVCEFKFQPPSSWNPAVPDLIYEKVQAQFPQRELMNSHDEQKPTPGAKTKFRRADGSALLQISPKLLAINQLRPYRTWPQFKKTILEAYTIYRELAQPSGIIRLGLRYINQIEIPETKIEIGRYLRGCPEGYHKLFLSTEFPFEAEEEKLAMILAYVPHREGDFLRFYLDLDYGAFPMPAEEIGPVLERAHDRLEQIFEASHTDETRRLFGEIKKIRPYPEADEQALVGVVHEVQAPYVTHAATLSPAVSSLKPSPAATNHALEEMSTTAVDSSAAVAFYRDRVLELGTKAGHWEDAEAREAERWENLELALGVEKDIVFKEPDVPKRTFTATVYNMGPAPVPPFFYDPVEE